jgi:hypothetical protein
MVQILQAPKAESTLFGSTERFITKRVAELRGHIGCRLNLSIQELPSLQERERAYGVLEELCKVPELSEVSSKLHRLLQDVHQALLAHTLGDRHRAFCQAIAIMESSEPLKQALHAKLEFPEEVSDYEEALRFSYFELSFAAKSLKDLTWWAQYGHFHQSEQVANYIARAHRWIMGAGRILF